jgi:DNA-directed RNA polymerase subunit RPC12/RpoP
MMASLAWPKPVRSAPIRKSPQRPDCPDCGSRLLLAETARFNLSGRIDHLWVCDDCGTAFETSMELKPAAAA